MTRARSALLPHNSCGKDCKPCTDCAFKQQMALDEAKHLSQMMKDQHNAHKEFRAQDCLQMLQMRQRLDEAYDDANAQRVQKVLATDQAAQLLNEKQELEVDLAMAEGRYEAALETIARLRECLQDARREREMPALEPPTPHKKRRIRPSLVSTPAPPLPPGSDTDTDDGECFCREEGTVSNPINL